MSFTSNQIAQLASDLAGGTQVYVVYHEDLHSNPGDGKWTHSEFTDKFWVRQFISTLEMLHLDYATEFDPKAAEEDGLAYEPLEDSDPTWDELLEEIEAPGFI